MIKLKDIEVISAFKASNQTGVLTPLQARSLSTQARNLASSGKAVAISMRGISSMSIDASTALCSDLVLDKNIASRVLIVGSTPYIDQIVGMGLRKASIKNVN